MRATGWDAPVAGMTWGWVGERGSWTGPEAEASFRAMAELNVTWVTLAYAVGQDTAHETTVRTENTVTEAEIRRVVGWAREYGMKVCLKPTVNPTDGTWRAYINFLSPDVPGEPTWSQWFASYGAVVLAAASLAQELGVEMLCIGCEMVCSDTQEALWRELVDGVRARYSGLVTYNCDKYQEDRLTWWDAVDVISSSGYYPSGTWSEHLDRIEEVVARVGKPFVFMEAGCPSRTGSPDRPNDWSLPGAPSEAAQAGYLAEMFAAIESRDWVGGVMLWDWPPRLYPVSEAASNDDYCMYGKAGASVVAERFGAWQG